MKTEVIERIVNNPSDRRKFMKRVGVTGLGVAAASMLGGGIVGGIGSKAGKAYASTAITDTDILNFALNLEYLEAEFYSVAVTGKTLLQAGILTASEESGPTTGGNIVDLGSLGIGFLATALRKNEEDHVLYLRAALGSAAVLKPTIDLGALGYGFSSASSFLELARQFEDVGVSAYLGAAPLITSSAYLAAAAAILATEAQHSGSIRLECLNHNVTSPAVDTLDIPPTHGTPYDVTSTTALSIPRTTAQVLNIVYAGGNCSGGFYPEGMNGTIVCQS
jgi:hypothetical protein